MAENRGGYRKPNNPAPVSGPGKLSQRTDGGPADTRQAQMKVTGMPYGENKELNEVQSQAPLASAATMGAAIPMPANPMPLPTPLTAPTDRPTEPVSAGMPFGPGMGTLPYAPITVDDSADKKRALVVLGLLQDSYNKGNASQGTVNLMRQLRSEI
ncbi:MAG: hypothetical protein EBT07_04835 [Actinobacteria bacterium]|nr:hypothetical protein [Actinomycetota bacterium]